MRSTLLSLLFVALLVVANVSAFNSELEEDIAILDLSESVEDYNSDFKLMLASSSSGSNVPTGFFGVSLVTCGTAGTTCGNDNTVNSAYSLVYNGVVEGNYGDQFPIGTIIKFVASQSFTTAPSDGTKTVGGFIACQNDNGCGIANNTASTTNIATVVGTTSRSIPLTQKNQQFQVTFASAGTYCYGDMKYAGFGNCFTASAFSNAVVSVASVFVVIVASLMVAL